MIQLVKKLDYLYIVWKKVVLRQSDYENDFKFPFSIEDLDKEVQNDLQKDFEGISATHRY